jgi:hypothetical protein
MGYSQHFLFPSRSQCESADLAQDYIIHINSLSIYKQVLQFPKLSALFVKHFIQT